jgi:SAM-dependent methyltransferase
MKLGAVPESLADRVALAFDLFPRPLGESLPTLLIARALMAAARFGFVAALERGPRTAAEVAESCGTHPRGTTVILDALVALEYARYEDGRYTLTETGRKWLLPDSPLSVHGSLLFRYVEWDLIARLDQLVETGRPVDLHGAMKPEQWALYQGAMASIARFASDELAKRLPVPRGARTMLDIGGSHGLFSVALCRRHPGLRAVVLDLPQAVEHAAPILAREGMGDRVVHRAGDALTDDLGEGELDLVLLSQLAHHFDEEQNRALTRRVARALRPGGVFLIYEILRRETPDEGGQIGALFDLYFALTSESGTWSLAEMASWQRDAGLMPRRGARMRTSPGFGWQAAVKPS